MFKFVYIRNNGIKIFTTIIYSNDDKIKGKAVKYIWICSQN
jgi:hypothetical protein